MANDIFCSVDPFGILAQTFAYMTVSTGTYNGWLDDLHQSDGALDLCSFQILGRSPVRLLKINSCPP